MTLTVVDTRPGAGGEPPRPLESHAERRLAFYNRLLNVWRRQTPERRLKKDVRSLLDGALVMARLYTESRIERMNARDTFEAISKMTLALALILSSETELQFQARFAQAWDQGWAD